jgi:hypothetical protein
MKTTFSALPVGTMFFCNGNICTKKSTRTAWINKNNTLWFYFGANESVRVTK